MNLTIDTINSPPAWFAVVIVSQPTRGKWERHEPPPRIRCIGFHTTKQRDEWLRWLNGAVVGLADTLPGV